MEGHRHVGYLLRRGVAGVVGTVQRVQPCRQLGQLGRGYPAVEGYDTAVCQQPLPVFLPHEPGAQPVAAQLQVRQLIAQRRQCLTGFLLLRSRLPQGVRQRRQVLLRRAAAPLQLTAGEAEAPQQLQRRRRDGLVGQQQDALLLPVGVQLIRLRLRYLRGQRALHLVPAGEGGQRAGGDVAPPRLRQLHRNVKAPPRAQRRLLAAQLRLSGGETVDVRRQLVDALRRLQLPRQRRLVQIRRFGDPGPGRQQPRLFAKTLPFLLSFHISPLILIRS